MEAVNQQLGERLCNGAWHQQVYKSLLELLPTLWTNRDVWGGVAASYKW